MKHDVKQDLLEWVVTKSMDRTNVPINYDTQLLEFRLIKSVDIADLILFLEHITGQPIDVNKLESGSFSTINRIYSTFVAGDES